MQTSKIAPCVLTLWSTHSFGWGEGTPLPSVIERAVAAKAAGQGLSGAEHASSASMFTGLTPEERIAVEAVLRIRGDKDLQSRVALDIVEVLIEGGRYQNALALARKITGYRAGVGAAKVARASAIAGEMESFRESLAFAGERSNDLMRTRQGQVIDAHIAAAHVAAGEDEAAARLRESIDLKDQKVLVESLCMSARAERGDKVSTDAAPSGEKLNVLRPAYLAKAEAILDAAEHRLQSPSAGDVTAGEEEVLREMLDHAINWAQRSRADAVAIYARAAGFYRKLGDEANAAKLIARAERHIEAPSGAISLAHTKRLRALGEWYLTESDQEAVRAKLQAMRDTLEMVPITQFAKSAGAAAEFAIQSGEPELAEEVLGEMLRKSADNPNRRIMELAVCYCAGTYARLGIDLPDGLSQQIENLAALSPR